MRIKYKGTVVGEEAKAVEAFSKGNNREALILWESIVESQPSNIPARKGIVLSILEEKKYDVALKYLLNTVQYASRDAELHNLVALCYLKQGKIDLATNTILDFLEYAPSELLLKTLEAIRKITNAIHARNMSIIPLIEITLPSPLPTKKRKTYDSTALSLLGIISLFVGIGYIVYPYLADLHLFMRQHSPSYIDSQAQAVKKSIRDIDNIISARSSFEYILSEKEVLKKFTELKLALKNQQYNRAQILVNTLLHGNVSESVKERIKILENLIPDAYWDTMDYNPSYRDIVIAPKIYQNTKVVWQGEVTNVHHLGRKKTTFDLLMNANKNEKVDGIANVEIDGFCAIKNNSTVTVSATVDGVTPDYRVNVIGSLSKIEIGKRMLSSVQDKKAKKQKNSEKALGFRISTKKRTSK